MLFPVFVNMSTGNPLMYSCVCQGLQPLSPAFRKGCWPHLGNGQMQAKWKRGKDYLHTWQVLAGGRGRAGRRWALPWQRHQWSHRDTARSAVLLCSSGTPAVEGDRTVEVKWRCCLIQKRSLSWKPGQTERVADATLGPCKVLTDLGKQANTAANKNTINDYSDQQQGLTRCSTGQNRHMRLEVAGAEVSELLRCSCQPCFELHVPKGKNPL